MKEFDVITAVNKDGEVRTVRKEGGMTSTDLLGRILANYIDDNRNNAEVLKELCWVFPDTVADSLYNLAEYDRPAAREFIAEMKEMLSMATMIIDDDEEAEEEE